MKYLLMSRRQTQLFGWSTPFTLFLVTLVVFWLVQWPNLIPFSPHPNFLLIWALTPCFTWSLPCSSYFQEELVSSFWLSIVCMSAWPGELLYILGSQERSSFFWLGPKEGTKEEAYKEVVGSITVSGPLIQTNKQTPKQNNNNKKH